MVIKPEDYVSAITKLAYQVGDDEGQVQQGQQTDDVPAILQPDKGPGSGPRGESESFSTGAEKAHLDNREGKYLPNAFNEFNNAARQAGRDLKGALSSFGPKAIVSRATPEAGATKISSAQMRGFADELCRIHGIG